MNEEILFYAFRYALGRRTYAVATVAQEIIDRASELSQKTMRLMCNEIAEAELKQALGDECDAKHWREVRHRLIEAGA